MSPTPSSISPAFFRSPPDGSPALLILVAKSLLKRLQGVALLNLKDLSGEQRIRRQYQLSFRTDFVRIVLVIHISVSAEIS
jgi:hypothetical protein